MLYDFYIEYPNGANISSSSALQYVLSQSVVKSRYKFKIPVQSVVKSRYKCKVPVQSVVKSRYKFKVPVNQLSKEGTSVRYQFITKALHFLIFI